MQKDGSGDSPAVASIRSMDILVALLLIVGAAIVIYDCVRLGFGWGSDGPAPGFFPFWVAVILAGSSMVNLAQAIGDREAACEVFVTRRALSRVAAVALPTLLYVMAIGGLSIGSLTVPGLGIYIASAVFIAGFMLAIGRESLLKALLVGIAVPVVMFFLFERWFLVPLPKGPFQFF